MMHKRRSSSCLIAVLLLTSVLAARAQTSSDLFWIKCRPSERSEDVRTLQYLLRARGYKVTADGIFGAQTLNAVKRLQRTKKLTADGVVGAKTWKALIITVKRGSRGDAVRAAQNALKAFPYSNYKVVVDGTFGVQTENEVKRLQRGYNLKQDGIVGLATWNMLLTQMGD